MDKQALLFIFAAALNFHFMGETVAYGQDSGLGRHKQLYVVPVPGKVVVDGKLDDWDLSGQIEMYVVKETEDTQSAKFAAMYDKDALYLSGQVRDTSPMVNRHDPKASGNFGWDADSCQIRLELDPSQPFPLKEGVIYPSTNGKIDNRDDIVHLTLWYYTDRAEPCLQIMRGMTYRVPPSLAPFGVVPSEKFEAKYVKSQDGQGYTFEYRIPWSTLGAKRAPQAGDTVAGTVNFLWGQTDGLKTDGGSAWAYDVMNRPGFAYQDASCWGKLIFSRSGHVSKELVDAGVLQEKPQPLEFPYTLPESGQVTIQLVDQNHLVRRIIVAQGDRPAGANVEKWDGLDDYGHVLPAGTYQVEGIIHQPITEKFRFSVHNSGNPPFPTDDHKGGWGGDEGNPVACSAFPGGMLLSWEQAEYGSGIIRVDLQGTKQWGTTTPAVMLANDGKRFFAYTPSSETSTPGIRVFDLADGRPIIFGNGSSLIQAPPGGTKDTDEPTGLASGAGKIFVSYVKRNLIGVFDSTSGKLEQTWAVPQPGALAVRPDGALIAVSDGKLVVVTAGNSTELNHADLDDPTGVALDKNGSIYISNRGKMQDVEVISKDGKLLRRIGKLGGRPAMGNYDASGMYMPYGIAVDENGRLWVAERSNYPRRISVWNATDGAFEKEFFGDSDYFGYADIDPARPDEIYCQNVLWHIDWDKYAVSPISTIWRKTSPDMMDEPETGAYPQGFRMFTAINGNQYGLGFNMSHGTETILYRREGNLFKPFLAKNGDHPYDLWQDLNDDGRVQPEEIQTVKGSDLGGWIEALGPDMTLWIEGGNWLKPTRWLENGQPFYDPEKIEKNFLAHTQVGGVPADVKGYLWLDPDGAVYTLSGENTASDNLGQLCRWSADGKLEWGYPGIPAMHEALSLPIVKAGRLYGLTDGLGVAGDFTGNMSYFGPCHLFTKQGIYTAAIFRDGRTGGLGADVGQPEGEGGDLVSLITKPGTAPRTFLLAGGGDGRVTEILGLDTVKPLPTTTFTFTDEQAKIASDALVADKSQDNQGQKFTIRSQPYSHGEEGYVGKVLDEKRSFKVRASFDAKNLFVDFDVTSPNDLINAAPDPNIIFKSGNCLDIQIGTDALADLHRKTPAPGDIRLLITRQTGGDGSAAPFTVLYRPKIKEFKGQPILLKSPTGSESFDDIQVTKYIGVQYEKTTAGFKAILTIPLDAIGLTLEKGHKIKMDVGYIYGNAKGTQTAVRSYLFNNSFSANVVNDIPNESRLEPGEWGEVEIK